MGSFNEARPTIKDVARACGVSVATVSYVINGTRVLRSDTRQRVLKTMEEMNFHPNAVARGLSSKRVHTLGVHCGVVSAGDFISNAYAAGLLSGIVTRAGQHGFDVTLFTSRWQGAARSLPALCDGRTDGILVVAPPQSSDIIHALAARSMPVVAIAAPPTPGIARVDVDNFAGAYLAAQHLLELGHTRIAALPGDADLASFASRRAGFCAALSERGVSLRDEWILPSRFSGEQARQQTLALLGTDEPPTAICAGNDAIALAVIEAARDAGALVPAQLSVVGFDDLPSAALVSPGLTTVRQPLEEIGARAAELLIAAMRGLPLALGDGGPAPLEAQESGPTFLLCPELVVRGTTAPPNGRHTIHSTPSCTPHLSKA